MCDVLTY